MGEGTSPAVAAVPSCPIGRRCHVSGKNLVDWNQAFSAQRVKDLASSSVALLTKPEGASQPKVFASGTLIAEDIVLCCAHSVENLSDRDIEVVLFFECDAKTAPPGHREQYDGKTVSTWKGCTPLRSKPQGRVLRAIERGFSADLDYTLFAIEWTEFEPGPTSGLKLVGVPRLPAPARPSRIMTSDVLLVAHPDGEPTQASAGTLTEQFGPNPVTGRGLDYAYSSFSLTAGSSGGGVFNTSGEIVGVLKGFLLKHGHGFLNLARVADNLPQSRIAQWLSQGDPRKPGDPKENVAFKVA
jgi:hypothetical protein